MTLVDATGIAASIAVVGGSVLATGRWAIKHYLAELKPNHGSSLHDTIHLTMVPALEEIKKNLKEVKQEVADTKERVAYLEGRFDQGIG